MACDKPTGDCTNVSPCGAGCGCNESTTPAPVLPKCQDVALAPGTFTNAIVTVNAAGCISAVASGEPELYTPDECCGGEGGTGGGDGARGPKGDPGAAATIAVQSVIGTGTTWSVENIGTSSAATFKFTAPAASTGGGSSGGGATGNVGGFEIVDGLVQDFPTTLVTAVEAKAVGTNAALILFQALPDLSNEGEWDITLNIDPLFSNLTQTFQGLHNDQQQTIDALVASLASAVNRIGTLEGKVSELEENIAPQFGLDSCVVWNKSGATITVIFEEPDGTQVGTTGVTDGSLYDLSSDTSLSAFPVLFLRVEDRYLGYCNTAGSTSLGP